MQNLGEYCVLNFPEFAVNAQFRLQVHTNLITGQKQKRKHYLLTITLSLIK